ncbi:STAS domain-containing protein [Actinoplanes italicus]|nr:STAS domain-containing protein [Actinoplanes italicus]
MGVIPVIEDPGNDTTVNGGTEIVWHAMPGASVVRVAGDVDLSTAARLRTAFEAALEESAWVIVDLRRAESVDSVGLGVLIAVREAARRRGGDLLLATASPFFVSVLRAARLDALFTLFDTVPRAITYALKPGLRSPGCR